MAFVQQLAVEVAEGVLPEKLLAGKRELFQFPVRTDEQMRRRRLETHAALDAEDGIAQMHAAADAIGTTDGVESGDECHGIECLAIDSNRYAFTEAQRQPFRREFPGVDLAAGKRGLGQGAPGIQRLATAHGGAPHALVHRIIPGLFRKLDTMLLEELHLLGAAQAQ